MKGGGAPKIIPNQPLNSNSISNSSTLISNKSSLIMLANFLKTTDNSDVQLYIEKVQNGTLYDYLRDEITKRKPEYKSKLSTRKKIKEVVFTVLFTDNRYMGQESAFPKQVFKELFPNVYSVFSMVKRTEKKDLPILLQKIESHLVLKRIARRLSKEKPRLPIFTIHDSIVTTKGNEEFVSMVMRDELLKALGVKPTLAYEYWSPDNLKK